MSHLAHARANENKLENVNPRFWKVVFICLNLRHRLIVSKVLYQESFYQFYVDYRRLFAVIFEIVCPWDFFYLDLQCPLISGRCTGRELTTTSPQ